MKEKEAWQLFNKVGDAIMKEEETRHQSLMSMFDSAALEQLKSKVIQKTFDQVKEQLDGSGAELIAEFICSMDKTGMIDEVKSFFGDSASYFLEDTESVEKLPEYNKTLLSLWKFKDNSFVLTGKQYDQELTKWVQVLLDCKDLVADLEKKGQGVELIHSFLNQNQPTIPLDVSDVIFFFESLTMDGVWKKNYRFYCLDGGSPVSWAELKEWINAPLRQDYQKEKLKSNSF